MYSILKHDYKLSKTTFRCVKYKNPIFPSICSFSSNLKHSGHHSYDPNNISDAVGVSIRKYLSRSNQIDFDAMIC